MPLSRPQLLELLDELFKSDADFDLFFATHFDEVYQRFASGMERSQKKTIVLRELADDQRLTDELQKRANSPAPQPRAPAPPAVAAPAPVQAKGRTKIVFLGASPTTMDHLGLAREARTIEERIRGSALRDGVEIVARHAVRIDDLTRALREEKPDILHFSGHGSPREQLILENDEGAAVRVDKEALVGLIGLLKGNLRLVVLNACDTGPIAEALVGQVDCAIGTGEPIGDAAAIAFAAAFYESIASGESVDLAFRLGCNALQLHRIPEDRTPRLSVKEGIDAAKIVLVGQAPGGAAPVAAAAASDAPAAGPAGRSPAAPSPEDPALADLRERYREGSVVIFAGAGISLAAGLPSWGVLVRMLAEHPRVREAPAESGQEIEWLIQTGKLIDALTAIEACLGPQEFRTVVMKALDDKPIAEIPEPARVIAELKPRLRAVLTTNLDRFLERAFLGAWPDYSRATADVVQGRHYILKLHGTLHDRGTWVLTRAEYDRAISADPLLRSAFSALYQAQTLLFVGYGLADDDLDLALGWVRANAAGQAPRHFALMPAGRFGPMRRRQLEDSGVRVIQYATPGGSHDEMVRMLRSLA